MTEIGKGKKKFSKVYLCSGAKSFKAPLGSAKPPWLFAKVIPAERRITQGWERHNAGNGSMLPAFPPGSFLHLLALLSVTPGLQ